MEADRDQPRDVRHVDQEIGADRIGDLAKAGEVDDTRIGGCAGDDQLRPVLDREPLDLLEIEEPVLAPDAVLHGREPLAGHGGLRAMGQVPAGVERHAEDDIARATERELDGAVGLCARVGLHVHEGAVEELLCPFDGQRLGDVDVLAAAVVAATGVTLGVFVGEHRALGLENRARDDVLGRDQLDLVLLPAQLAADRGEQIRIRLGEAGLKEAAAHRIPSPRAPPRISIPRH
jgi:hypothetical protein